MDQTGRFVRTRSTHLYLLNVFVYKFQHARLRNVVQGRWCLFDFGVLTSEVYTKVRPAPCLDFELDYVC